MKSRRSYLVTVMSLALLLLVTGALPVSAARRAAQPSADESYDIAVYRVDNVITREDRTAIAQTGASIDEIGKHYVIVSATPQEASAIAALGYPIQPVVGPLDFPPADAAYHNYAEMSDEILAVATAHPDIVSRFSVGQSYEGREMWAVKISDNVATDEDEPEVLFIGQHHAREHITVEMTLYILHLLADNYGTDQQITDLVNSREIYIIFTHQPGRRRIRHRDRLVSLVAQEPPAQLRIVLHRHRPEPQLRLQVGLLRRVERLPVERDLSWRVGLLRSRDAAHSRLHQQPRRGRQAADQDLHHVPLVRASWSSGRTATPTPMCPAT